MSKGPTAIEAVAYLGLGWAAAEVVKSAFRYRRKLKKNALATQRAILAPSGSAIAKKKKALDRRLLRG